MDITKTVKREEVQHQYTWNLEDLYKKEDFDKALSNVEDLIMDFNAKYKGKLTNKDAINNALDEYKEIFEKAQKVSSFAGLSASVDLTNREMASQEMNTTLRLSKVFSELSFLESEILENDSSILKEAAENKSNSHYLNHLLEEKPHRLDKQVEKALSSLSQVFGSFYRVYEAAKFRDMKFPDFIANGESHQLSYNIFEGLTENDPDTELRRNSFVEFSKILEQYKEVTAQAYLAHCQAEKAIATLRGFDSVIDYLLFQQRIPRDLYNRQIDTIMSDLAPHMRKYAGLIKKAHNLDKMTYMDLKVDLDTSFDKVISVDEGSRLVKEGLSVLGEEYGDMLQRSFDERWIDFVNNVGKSTGAFCASPYGSHSYILISWTGKLTEAMVLAHELGHAGHFFNCQNHQNILDTEPSLYFIEAPSTANELIMANHLVKNAQSEEERKYMLSQIISRTYYHNFVTHLLEAAYQREVYQLIDQGESFGADELSEIYLGKLKEFWGDSIEYTKGCELTWMRQPHYYMGLYPYTYSAGLTIGTVVSKMIMEQGQEAVDRWIATLRAGGTKDSIELAAMAGVDITTDQPLKDTIAYIGSIIDELGK